jgi:large subunit ribosomal protein L9
MDVILLKDLDKVGYKHDIVKVKNGFGRNYLIPKKLAVIANAINMKKLDKIKEEYQAKEAAKLGEYQELAKQLEGKTLKLGVKAGTSGKIFGSVTNVQIMNAIKEQFDMDIERRKIVLNESIKEVGNYVANIELHPEVAVELPFELIKE